MPFCLTKAFFRKAQFLTSFSTSREGKGFTFTDSNDPHRIHGTGRIYLHEFHEWLIFIVNVGMDPMGSKWI